MSKYAFVVAWIALATACSQSTRPAESNAGASGSDSPAGQGGSGSQPGPRPQAGGSSANTGECTPDLGPDNEFFVPCEDAGQLVAFDASREDPPPDASEPVPEPDAGEPEPDASEPMTMDEGPCADRTESCDVGHAETVIGSATCAIDGNSVSAFREICEVCDKSTALIDFSLAIMNCGVCEQIYRETPFTPGHRIEAGACEGREDSADLEWTASDPFCIDVYAYIGSGLMDGFGSSLQVPDQVRICRCDRTTDTCVSCANGACDSIP